MVLDYIFAAQYLSHAQLFVTPWTAACQASLSFTISQSLLKLMFIDSVMPSNRVILCHPINVGVDHMLCFSQWNVSKQTSFSWFEFSSFQFSCSVMVDSLTSWTAACQASLSITSFQSLLKLMSIELVMPSNHLILCHPLLLLPSIFSNVSVLCIRWPKY